MVKLNLFLSNTIIAFACALIVSISSLALYHHYYLRPHESIVVDFRFLSEAKLSQLVSNANNADGQIGANDLQFFLDELSSAIQLEAKQLGKPIFMSGAVFSPSYDITYKIATYLGIDIKQSLNNSLSNIAKRTMQSLPKNESTPK